MLIVIAIIVLAITLAVPAVRSLTGSRSQAAGQNVISAVLSRARAEAIGLQRVQGVLFFIDPATDRVSMAQVIQAANEASPKDAAGVTYLDLTPDRDVISLPPGIRLQMLNDTLSNEGKVPLQYFAYQRYLGFNDTAFFINNPTDASLRMKLGGVILFDAQGRLIVRQYGFRYANYPITTTGAFGKPQAIALGLLAFQAAPDPGAAATNANQNSGIWPTFQQSPNQIVRSQIGFVLFDREAFRSNGFTDDDGSPTVRQPSQAEQSKESWLDQNSTPILVNRYNGTLLRAE